MRFKRWINHQTYIINFVSPLKVLSSVHEKFEFWTGSNIQQIASMLSYMYFISISSVKLKWCLNGLKYGQYLQISFLAKMHFWMRSVSKKKKLYMSYQAHSNTLIILWLTVSKILKKLRWPWANLCLNFLLH